MNEDIIVLCEAPKIIPPEFRLYYDKQTGNVLFYTCEKPDGDFIVIDALTFATARPDIRVIDGRVSNVQMHAVVHKLMPTNEIDTQACAEEDISIVVDSEYTGNKTNWKLISYEL